MSWKEETEPRRLVPDAADQAAAIEAVARFLVDFEAQAGQPLRCPGCGATSLFPITFEVSIEYDTNTEQISEHPRVNVAPAAIVGCSRCPSLLSFSWLWIKERYGKR